MTRQKKQWREITLLVPHLWAEVLPYFLEERGFSGLWVDEEAEPPQRLLLRAYMDEAAWKPKMHQALEDKLQELSRVLPTASKEIELSSRVIEEENWAAQWLPFFQPVKIGPVWVRPSQKPVALKQGEQDIVLDPGQAFGTGHHETTQLCLESTLRLRSSLGDDAQVLDLGTGSGILAMFAARLGFRNVLALDTDPVAVEVALQNVAKNGLEHVIDVSHQTIQSVASRFNLILANLTAAIHEELCEEMVSRLHRGGWIVLGGILRQEKASLEHLFSKTGLKLVTESPKNDWTCLSYRMPGD
jgi:ribosomal protein L11 methyltransferase